MEIIECVNCHKQKEHVAKGLCCNCYSNLWKRSNKDKVRLYRANHCLKYPLSILWYNMKQRCYNNKNRMYKY